MINRGGEDASGVVITETLIVSFRLIPQFSAVLSVKVQGSGVGQQRTDITEKLSESERLMKVMSQTWEEKLVETERLQHERQQSLEKMGISVQASGIQVEKNKYYLVNLNDDPSLNELLVYYLKVLNG